MMQSNFLNMSNGQLRPNAINDARVLEAMAAVPRERFVPEAMKDSAYVDEDIALGHGRYLLEPLVFATLLERARIEPHHHVLIVGGGFGYSAAVIAHLAQSVVMVEEVEALAVEARGRLSGQGNARIEVVHAPLIEGAPAQRPYDVIVVEGAVAHIPATLSGQLRDPGVLVGLLAGAARPGSASALSQYLILKREGGVVSSRHEGNAFVHALPAFAAPAPFRL